MRLTVLSVAFSLAPVGPDAAGGAEQVLSTLDRALVRGGHRSIVVAQVGSVTTGELVSIPRPTGRITEIDRRMAKQATRHAMDAVLTRERVDVIHMHGVDFADTLPSAGPPVLVTLHLPPAWYPPEALHPLRPDTWLVCVSHVQHATCPPSAALLPTIENGVDVEALDIVHNGARNYVASLGRICPEKGQHLALDAAHRAGVSLVVGGAVFPYKEHQKYYLEQIAPRLDNKRRFLGAIGFAQKCCLLAAARCLLLPNLAAETSSLVAMEALSCGTPVIAFPSGALADIIRNGVTGFLVKDVPAMADAISQISQLNRSDCRAEALLRFSEQRMTFEYLALYAKLAA